MLAKGPVIASICEKLNPYLETLNGWFSARGLTVSTVKTTSTVFTS